MVSLLAPQPLDIHTGSTTINQQGCLYLRHNHWAARGALMTPEPLTSKVSILQQLTTMALLLKPQQLNSNGIFTDTRTIEQRV